MFFVFIVLRFYSKFIQKVGFLISSRKRFFFKVEKYLSYPANIKKYEDIYHSKSKFKLNTNVKLLKEYSKYCCYDELVSLHKYYNTVLNMPLSICLYHEILRRNLKVKALLRSFGFRRFLAAQIMLGGIGIPTVLNKRYSKKLISVLCFFSSFDSSKEFSNYIRGKSVSLCGGAPSPRENIKKILGNDLVVRLNRDEISVQKTDIVYFRSEKLNYLAKQKKLADFSKMKCRLSIKTFRYYIKLRYFYRMKNIAPTVSLDAAFDCGKLNAIPTAALDLISKSSGIVYIFDTDLNLSKMHKEGYRGNEQPDIDFGRIFGEHPSYTQYTVLRYLNVEGYVQFETNPNFDIEWKYSKFIRIFSRVYN